jgi:acyl-ACP thioesterase
VPPTPTFLPEPPRGRVFAGTRQLRATDVTPAGRLRLDAVARYLQDVAEDDVADTGWRPAYGWLLRRCAISVRDYPGLGPGLSGTGASGTGLTLRTFCSGTGPRWAERTTTVLGADGTPLIQAVAIWVSVDPASGQLCPLGEEFHRFYGEAGQGRRASARLQIPGPDETPAAAGTREARDWPVRAADLDTAGHMNNTVYWAAIEDVIAGAGWVPGHALVEYHRPVLPGSRPVLLAETVPTSPDGPGQVRAWLTEDGARFASAVLTQATGAVRTQAN